MRRSAAPVLALLLGLTLAWVAAAASPAQVATRPAEAVPQTALPTPSPFAAARTERLLHERLACLGCHRLGGEGGRIGPTLEGVGQRLEPGYVLAMIMDPQATLPGTRMPRQPMRAAEARRLAAYLVAREPSATATEPGGAAPDPIPPAASPDAPPDGARLYARHCAACHGPTGDGDGWNAPDLPVRPTAHSDATLMERRPDDSLYDAIYAGAFVLDGSPRMPAFGSLLSDAEIRALVAHIRVLCACEGPAWSRDGAAGR